MKILEVIGLLALAIGLSFLNLFMMIKVYGYVLVPLGAPVLGLMQMWGVCLFIGCFTPMPPKEEDSQKRIARGLMQSASIAFAWLLAYLFFS